MKLSYLLVIVACIIVSCKSQENQQQSEQQPQLLSIAEFKPNPDDVVLYLKLIDTKELKGGWISNVEVKKQLKAGFGYKNRLSPGDVISLNSKDKPPVGDFYCAAESEVGGTKFTLKALLRN